MNSQSLEDGLPQDADEDAPAVDVATDAESEFEPSEIVIRSREEHGISRRDIDEHALKVLYRLTRKGFTAYLVGGGVRDLLLGRKPKDFDISTNARPEEIRALFRNCILIGRRFRLAHIRFGEKIIETSTFRCTPVAAGDPTDPDADLFQRDDNMFGTPEEDALRRDFTVNGLFYDIDNFSVIDYVGGMEDLAARRIRSIGDANIRFREDPVRMVRAIRFASRLDFDFDPDTLEAIRKHGEELAKASPARLLEEIIRLFAFSSGEKAVRLLNITGLLRVVLPELSDWLEAKDSDVAIFWERLRALDAGDTVLPDATPGLIFSTLLADPMAAMLAKDRRPASAKPKFDKIRAFLGPISQRLRFPRKLTERIVHMFVSQHRFFHASGRKGHVAGFVTQDWFHEALALAEINLTAEGKSQSALNAWRDLLAERIYGRDEAVREIRHAAAKAEEEEESPGENGGSLPPEGKKLSRSARRRRNKQRNRRARREAENRAKTAGEEHNGEAAADSVAGIDAPAPVPAPAEAEVKPVREAEPAQPEKKAEETPDSAQPTEGESKGKKGKSSRRRGSAKKKDAKQEKRQEETAAEPEETGAAPVPLRAAAFYKTPAPEPEPEPEPEKEQAKKSGKKSRSPRKKAAKAVEGEEKKTEEKPKPLAMDRADEAEIPMHWLDEI